MEVRLNGLMIKRGSDSLKRTGAANQETGSDHRRVRDLQGGQAHSPDGT